MLFPASGRNNFELLDLPAEVVCAASELDAWRCSDRATLLRALARDDELRRSKVVQDLLTASPECTTQILTMCQQYACLEAGFEDPEVGVHAIRSVPKRFPRDAELLSTPMWIRENLSRAGDNVVVGQPAFDVPVTPVVAAQGCSGKIGRESCRERV